MWVVISVVAYIECVCNIKEASKNLFEDKISRVM